MYDGTSVLPPLHSLLQHMFPLVRAELTHLPVLCHHTITRQLDLVLRDGIVSDGMEHVACTSSHIASYTSVSCLCHAVAMLVCITTHISLTIPPDTPWADPVPH